MAAPTWTPPSELDEYRLLRRLGHGAMGQVWLAQDTLLERQVAVKFIGVVAADAATRERFLIEARAIARLSHPNVVTIHRIGALDVQPYIVTEIINGQSLDKLARPVSSQLALSLAIDLSRGLAAAHRAGVLHRDVKPANAMLSQSGGAKLLDFGLAKLFEGLEHPPRVVEPLTSQKVEDANATLPGAKTAPVSAAALENTSGALTHAGMLMGTPAYLAPECWAGQLPTQRSDVYALGVLLYELCAGRTPVNFLPAGAPGEMLAQHAVRPLHEVAPQVDTRFAHVIDRCLERDSQLRPASGDELREAFEQLTRGPRAHLPQGNPYRGLAAFEAEHRALFFGRAAETAAVIERLKQRALVVVVGESGVGKSSLCRASVLPAVRDGALGDGRTWLSAICLPGRYPLRSLVAACAAAVDVPSLLNESADLADEPSKLVRELSRALGPRRGLLIFIDQLEEWATFADPAEAQAAARAVAELASGCPGVRVVATARSDLLPRLTGLGPLGADLSSSLYLLGALQPQNLREVIEGPAEALGVHFESKAMVEALAQLGSNPGALPLLQFALAQLWARREGASVLKASTLTEMGGVAGALARHADAALERMPKEQAAAAEHLLVDLVTADDQRHRRLESELVRGDQTRRAALHLLAQERLVTARDSEAGTEWEIAHEVLLREWPTLKGWLAGDADARAARERLRRAVAEWVRLGRASEGLWSMAALTDFAKVSPALTDEPELAFIAASRRRARWVRLRPRLFVGGLVLAVLAGYGSTRALANRRSAALADLLVIRGQQHLTSGLVSRAEWERASAEALSRFDEGDFAGAEPKWALAQEARQRWLSAVSLGSAEADEASRLLPEKPNVRGLVEAVGLQQLGLSLSLRNEVELDTVLARLDALGTSAQTLAPFRPTGRVTLFVEPSHAKVTVAAQQKVAGRWVTEPVKAFNENAELASGSYLFTVSASGFATASLPVMLERNDWQELHVKLIATEQLPEGFVLIPAGRTLVGSGGDDSVRNEFYQAAPLHPVVVKEFIIGQHEVTFAQWLNYLDSLSAEERARRTPRVTSGLGTAFASTLKLTLSSEGWAIDFAPVSHRYQARADRPFEYLERSVNARQSWLQFPVVGVSPVDIEAYAQWLDSTRRVPGARLCTENEWERAARGADGRTLTVGEVLQPDEANIDVTYGLKDAAYGPDQVGLHPASDSVFGVADLVGNVWEVVRPAARGKEYVSKGGGWNVGLLPARAPNNWVINSQFRQVETGARLCAPAP